jgi:hypothetical protein
LLIFQRTKTLHTIGFRSRTATLLLAIALALFINLVAPPETEAAERAWIRGEIRLNVRSGPGTAYRILGGVATGDGLSVLERGEGWTKVRLADATEGWIPVGYLKAEPPPTIRLAQLEAEVTQLRSQLESTSGEGEELRTANETLSQSDGLQRTEIDRLILENTKLRAGARYPELIAGASILAAGMILGAMLHKSSASRRPASRIRL